MQARHGCTRIRGSSRDGRDQLGVCRLAPRQGDQQVRVSACAGPGGGHTWCSLVVVRVDHGGRLQRRHWGVCGTGCACGAAAACCCRLVVVIVVLFERLAPQEPVEVGAVGGRLHVRQFFLQPLSELIVLYCVRILRRHLESVCVSKRNGMG